MIELTEDTIDTSKMLGQVAKPDAGAVVLFLGTTRGVTGGRHTESLDYECYPQMAWGKLQELQDEVHRRWTLSGCTITHRLGRLDVGETSVAVAVSAAHRQEAFEAAKWLIDTLKESVPIWKRENWADGESQWVHPGIDTSKPMDDA